jgi:hypothetical protein
VVASLDYTGDDMAINVPPGAKQPHHLQIRSELVTICEKAGLTYPTCGAAMLHIIERWCAYNVQQYRQDHCTLSLPKLKAETFGLFGKTKLTVTRDELIRQGWIVQLDGVGFRRAYRYRFDEPAVQKAVDEAFSDASMGSQQHHPWGHNSIIDDTDSASSITEYKTEDKTENKKQNTEQAVVVDCDLTPFVDVGFTEEDAAALVAEFGEVKALEWVRYSRDRPGVRSVPGYVRVALRKGWTMPTRDVRLGPASYGEAEKLAMDHLSQYAAAWG